MENNLLPSETREFLEWLTRKDSQFSVLYGEKCRFATKEKDYTIDEVYDIFCTRHNKQVSSHQICCGWVVHTIYPKK